MQKEEVYDPTWIKFNEWTTNLKAKTITKDESGIEEKLKALSSNEERVELVLQNTSLVEQVKRLADDTLANIKTTCKSDKDASRLRERGNKAFKAKKLEKSAMIYTEGIRKASWFPSTGSEPRDGCELSLLFANRSAALFHMNHYLQALQDIEKALILGYPKDQSTKLLLRKISCLISLSKFSEAKSVINDLMNAKGVDSVTTNKLHNLMKQVIAGDSKSVLEEDQVISHGVCGSLTLKNSNTKGRHMVASKPIEINDVLLIEKPYSSLLERNCFESFCQHCMAYLNSAGLPCENCDEILYCNDECKMFGSVYHAAECNKVLPLYEEIGIGYLAVRTTLIANLPFRMIKNNENVFETEVAQNSCYSMIMSLVEHHLEWEGSEILENILTSIFMAYVLSKEVDTDPSTKNFSSLVNAILLHLQQLTFNTVSINCQTASVRDIDSNLNIEEKRVGYGLYPTLSMFNHSCKPNVVTLFTGSTVEMRASQSLGQGDEVCYCYGPSLRNMTYKDRQTALKKQYFFNCQCSACETKMENKSNAFACISCKGAVISHLNGKGSCLSCGLENIDLSAMTQELQEAREHCEEGMKNLEMENFDDAVIKLFDANKIMDKILYRNNNELKEIKDKMCTCIAMMQHYDVALKYFNQALTIIKATHGEESVEYLTAMLKVVSLKYNCLKEVDEGEKLRSQSTDLMNLIDSLINKFTKLSMIVGARLKQPNNQFYNHELAFLQQHRKQVVRMSQS